jgi:hypothetical protein
MIEIVNAATSMRACFPQGVAANVRQVAGTVGEASNTDSMWPFRKKTEAPGLGAEPDPERHELLQSQLRGTLTYGWSDKETHDAVAFLQSLPPADDTSHIGDRLGGSSPPR